MKNTVSMTLATLMHTPTVFVMVACGNGTPGDKEDTCNMKVLSVA